MSGIVGLPNIKGSGVVGPPAGTVLQTQRYSSSDQVNITSDSWSTAKVSPDFLVQ